VRCVVAAGWAVNDDAASTFASTFFERLTQGETFGDALFAARKSAHQQHPGSNTWGAYQAYGDPGYRLRPQTEGGSGGKTRAYVAVEELLSELQRRRVANKRRRANAKPLTFAQHSQWVRRQLGKCPPEWAERPDVLQAIGELYGELGGDGFNEARATYQRAIQQEDASGRVALRSIEQLANMEARHGGKLADQGRFDQAMPQIDSAIGRLNALADSVRGEATAELNGERACLLGSALKLKAAALAGMPKPVWKKVSVPLGQAARAYASAVAGDPARSPYNTLNWLPLAWLTGTLDRSNADAASLARRCGDAARRQFASSKDFWHAVMSADAEMTAWLLDGTLQVAASANKQASPASRLHQLYEQAVETLPQSARQWDSVVKQWRLLARFLRLRPKGEGSERAEVLDELADFYVPRTGEPATSEGVAGAVSEEPAARPGKTRTRKQR
jgi:hypothetical protein